MKEEYLHFLWRWKRLPFHRLKLSDGTSFEVIHPGNYNHSASGPDFQDARIRFGEVLWVGSVEIHIRSSDWMQHGHHQDPAYNNVILHVVLEHNREIFIDQYKLPVLELRHVIDNGHFRKFRSMHNGRHEIPCGRMILTASEIHITQLKEKALYSRLLRKGRYAEQHAYSSKPSEVLYFLMASAMGAGLNKLPFEELAVRLPYDQMKMFKKKQVDLILQYVSGLGTLEVNADGSDKVKELIGHIGKMNCSSWRFKGIRPASFPDKRIRSFADLLADFDFELAFVYLSSSELCSYFQKLCLMRGNEQRSGVTKGMLDALMINAIVPFLFWYGDRNGDESLTDKALDVLRVLSPEKNHITEKWVKHGVNMDNAADTQAFIEIYHELCTGKKCLSCVIGIQLLKP